MRVIVFMKMFKIESKFRKCKRKLENIFLSEINASENVAKIVSVKKRILIMDSERINSQS